MVPFFLYIQRWGFIIVFICYILITAEYVFQTLLFFLPYISMSISQTGPPAFNLLSSQTLFSLLWSSYHCHVTNLRMPLKSGGWRPDWLVEIFVWGMQTLIKGYNHLRGKCKPFESKLLILWSTYGMINISHTSIWVGDERNHCSSANTCFWIQNTAFCYHKAEFCHYWLWHRIFLLLRPLSICVDVKRVELDDLWSFLST